MSNPLRFAWSEASNEPTDHLIDQVTRESRAIKRLKGKIKETKPKNGNKKYSNTDGLRPVVKDNKPPRYIETDDEDVIDIRRIRSTRDLE